MEEKKQKNKRCALDGCNKKIKITDFACRCDKIYCKLHRLAESHECTYDFKKIDIYFKGGQGLDNVISEYIVEPKKIIDTFIDNGFELLEFTKFMENNPTKFGLHKYELQVSNLYTTYVFNYKK